MFKYINDRKETFSIYGTFFFDFPSCRYVLFSVENVIMQVVYK